VALEILAEDSDLAIRTLGDYELLEEIALGEWGEFIARGRRG